MNALELLLLYGTFFRIGAFAIGGGLATLPFLYELSERVAWLPAQRVGELQALAQTAPGAIGVNLSALTGFEAAGIPGAAAAALGLISPSIIIIVLIARALKRFKENPWVQAAFRGLRPVSAALLTAALWVSLQASVWNGDSGPRPLEALVFALLIPALRLRLHPGLYIVGAAVAGVALKL